MSSSREILAYEKQRFTAVGKRLLTALLFFTATRFAFYLCNRHYYAGTGFGEVLLLHLKGIYFDISAIAALSSVYLISETLPFPGRNRKFYRVLASLLFVLPNLTGLLANLVDAAYYPFTLKRLTFDIFDYLGSDSTSVSLLPKYLLSFWYLSIPGAVLLFSFCFINSKIKLNSANPVHGIRAFFIQAFLFIITVITAVVLFRGGFQLKPINIITAGQFTSAENVPLVLNTPFTLIKTFNHKGLEQKHYFSDSQADSIFSPVSRFTASSTHKLNVVILIMESFSNEHIGYLNRNAEGGAYRGFTPFMDSLIPHSLFFSNAFANGKRSIEGIPAILSGLPTLMEEAYITSNYAGNRINSIASLLKPFGYTTAFYHGGANGTMGFESFTRMAGFDNYYGRNEYPDQSDFDGNWGIWDEPYFQYFARQLNSTPQPFCAAVFSLSSHHPYKVPAKHSSSFRKGKLEIQQSIMYADYSLKRFFESASKMPWYNNTLFVLVADHTSEAIMPYYQTRAGNFRIPVLFFSPSMNLARSDARIVQQADITPSVLHLLGLETGCVAFGKSVLDTCAGRFAVTYLNGAYQLIKDNYALQSNGNESTGLFYLPEDSLMTNNLIKSDTGRRQQLERFLNAYIQQYNNRMISNNLRLK